MPSIRHVKSDNIIIVKDNSNGLEYIDTVKNFETDSGISVPSLTDGIIVRWYSTKGYHKISDGSSEYNMEYPVPVLENLLSNVQGLIDAKNARINPPLTLDEKRAIKNGEIKGETIKRIAAINPALDDFKSISLLASICSMLNTGSASADMIRVKDTYIYAKNKIIWANSASETELNNYDPKTDINWP